MYEYNTYRLQDLRTGLQTIGWVGTTASTIAAQPILLLACVGVPLCGLGVGLFKRLLSARA